MKSDFIYVYPYNVYPKIFKNLNNGSNMLKFGKFTYI